MALFDSVKFRIVLPYCPTSATFFSYPSTTIIFLIAAVVSAILGSIAAVKYNSVRVFNRRISTPNISNSRWVFYFCAVFFRCLSEFFRYALYFKPSDTLAYDTSLWMTAIVFEALVAFSLAIALEHQWKYRSPGSPPPTAKPVDTANPAAADATEQTKLLWSEKIPSIKKHAGLIALSFLFFFSVLFGFLEVWEGSSYPASPAFRILYLVAYIIQRIPIIIYVILIVANRDSPDGPTKVSKGWLIGGAVLGLVNELPIEIWGSVLPAGCPFAVASWVDVILVLFLFCMICFFLFLRCEYKRNMEETIWNTVSQIQDTFDFRRF